MTPHRAGRPLAVSMGDPAGIGPDITLMAWKLRHTQNLPPFALFADPDILTQRAAALGLDVPIAVVTDLKDAMDAFASRLPVSPLGVPCTAMPRLPSPDAAPAILASIERSVAAVMAGDAAAVVTNPIAKSVLYEAGFAHPGHTEFLADLAARHSPDHSYRPVMMLASDHLRVVPLTIHIPLADVPLAVTRQLLLETAHITNTALIRDFAIDRPRIAICGLNPHAGEGGTIGREDVDIIAPAIEALQAEGMHVTGPHSADTLFHAAARTNYDAALCMYHDQALIPIKTLAFDEGVNVTLGLPFVRTSPDHGTAFSIAASGQAAPTSFIAACHMAHAMAARRQISAAPAHA